jgi:hypothetical protein
VPASGTAALAALTHIIFVVAAATSDLARAAARTAGLTRSTAALAQAAPGTTKLLVIGVVKGDRGVNAAGPGRVSIATRKRGLLRWGLN